MARQRTIEDKLIFSRKGTHNSDGLHEVVLGVCDACDTCYCVTCYYEKRCPGQNPHSGLDEVYRGGSYDTCGYVHMTLVPLNEYDLWYDPDPKSKKYIFIKK